jgi:saccharopine dehydrogenase-like NADP-dependent oxidoreductase
MEFRPNILVIGASGGVAGAFLRKVVSHRNELNRLVLVDKTDHLLANRFIPHRALEYEFVNTTVDMEKEGHAYLDLLDTSDAQVVIDLSVNESRRMLDVTDRAGVSYINTGIMNGRDEKFLDVVLDLCGRKESGWHAPHILCAGMNPGIVNLWVRQEVERSGVPRRVVHFEYDTGQPVHGWMPINTWSLETLLDEIVNDPAGYMEGKDKPVLLYPNPIKNRVDMKDVLNPIMELDEYPRGFLLLHEENITVAQRYDVPSQFKFAIHMKTMDYLEQLFDREGAIPMDSMKLGDNRTIPLEGSVTVGVSLEYDDHRKYVFNMTSHDEFSGSSGSCWQVAAGLHAALFTLLRDHLDRRIYFPEDLLGTSFDELAERNLSVQRVVIQGGLHDQPKS